MQCSEGGIIDKAMNSLNGDLETVSVRKDV